MNQQNLNKREDQSQKLSTSQVDANWNELNDRTAHSDTEYNSIALLGSKLKQLVLDSISFLSTGGYAGTAQDLKNDIDAVAGNSGGGGIPEAPIDTEVYARSNSSWLNIFGRIWNKSSSGTKMYTTGRVAIGNNDATGTDYLSVGNAKNGSTADAKILVNHTVISGGNTHGFTDETQWNSGATPTAAFNSFQAKADINSELDHYNGFQVDTSVNAVTTGLFRGLRVSAIGSGTFDEYRGIEILEPLCTGAKFIGLFINKIDDGTVENRSIRTYGGLVEFGNNGYTGDVDSIWLSRNDITSGEKQIISFRVGSSNVEASAIGNEWKGGGDGELFFKTTLNNISTERMRIKDNGVVNISGLPIFADESAASSLSTGDMYKTATGELRIKL